jgi:RHS repeat-associated protein
VVVSNSVTDSTKTDFVYDGRMRRRVRTEAAWQTSAWVTNTVVRYVYDGMRVIQERDGSNTVSVTYTRGQDLSGSLEGAGGIGGLLARTHPGSHHFYYHSDGNGNITAAINQATNLVAQYRYDPYGNLIYSKGALADINLYRFSSKEFTTNSGLYYYGFRFYDPNLQRWLNRDPLGDWGSGVYMVEAIAPHIEPRGSDETAAIIDIVNNPLAAFARVNLNLYGAMGNNPMSNVDPLGLDFASCYANCLEQYRNPLTEQLPNWVLNKLCPGSKLPSWVPAALYGGNALGNVVAGPTGRTGIGGVPSHSTTWQHKVGSKFGGFGSRIGRFLGRASIVLTVAEGFYDIGLLGGCAASCAGE